MKDLSKKIVIANWKSSLGLRESLALEKKLENLIKKESLKNKVVVLPDILALGGLKDILKKRISLGVQNFSPFGPGAYTGESSLESLSQLGIEYALLGHSERRQYFQENKLISQKMVQVLQFSKITPILCVGETWPERRAGKTNLIIKKQIKEAFSQVKTLKNKNLIIAYEPVWAIGSGKTVSVDEAVLTHRKIKDILLDIFKNNSPEEFGVIYGGSVNLSNYQNFKNKADISGLLIGGASLQAGNFIKIAKNF